MHPETGFGEMRIQATFDESSLPRTRRPLPGILLPLSFGLLSSDSHLRVALEPRAEPRWSAHKREAPTKSTEASTWETAKGRRTEAV